jgi:hypothetical protein
MFVWRTIDRSEQLHGRGREGTGRVSGHGEAAEQVTFAQHGHREHRPDPGLDQDLAQPALAISLIDSKRWTDVVV